MLVVIGWLYVLAAVRRATGCRQLGDRPVDIRSRGADTVGSCQSISSFVCSLSDSRAIARDRGMGCFLVGRCDTSHLYGERRQTYTGSVALLSGRVFMATTKKVLLDRRVIALVPSCAWKLDHIRLKTGSSSVIGRLGHLSQSGMDAGGSRGLLPHITGLNCYAL